MGNRVFYGETTASNYQTFPSSNESNDEFIPVRLATGVGDTRYNPILPHPLPFFTRNGPIAAQILSDRIGARLPPASQASAGANDS